MTRGPFCWCVYRGLMLSITLENPSSQTQNSPYTSPKETYLPIRLSRLAGLAPKALKASALPSLKALTNKAFSAHSIKPYRAKRPTPQKMMMHLKNKSPYLPRINSPLEGHRRVDSESPEAPGKALAGTVMSTFLPIALLAQRSLSLSTDI